MQHAGTPRVHIWQARRSPCGRRRQAYQRSPRKLAHLLPRWARLRAPRWREGSIVPCSERTRSLAWRQPLDALEVSTLAHVATRSVSRRSRGLLPRPRSARTRSRRAGSWERVRAEVEAGQTPSLTLEGALRETKLRMSSGSSVGGKSDFSRAACQLGAALRAQLALDVPAMELGRSDRDVELCSDLSVGVSVGQEPQHLEFALGQQVRVRIQDLRMTAPRLATIRVTPESEPVETTSPHRWPCC
jgi:hypothetical protein